MLTDTEISKMQTYLRGVLIDEFVKQGHSMPKPKWQQSVEVISRYVGTGLVFEVSGAEYGKKYVNVKMESTQASFKMFPFVLKYAKNRFGLTEADAKVRAAMIIRSWMKKGRPSPGSYSHSKTGKRTEFIESAQDEIEKNFGDFYMKYKLSDLNRIIKEIINKINENENIKITVTA